MNDPRVVKPRNTPPPIMRKGGPMKDKTKVLPRKEKHTKMGEDTCT